jgi:superoxide dismutase, Fe-Mn family
MRNYLYLITIFSASVCLQQLQGAIETKEEAKQSSTSPASYQIKNFNHLIGNVAGLNDDLLKMHFKLYEGYVNNTNIILQKLQALTAAGQNRTPEFAALKRILGWEFDGMLLHEYYFENLGGTKQLDPKDPLQTKINQDFGNYENWKADFIATGLMRGIGWVVAYIDPKNGRLINVWINEHDLGHLAGGTPLLIMDVFEHAYITQFALDRSKYIDVFFNNINWDAVSKRFANLKSK